MKFKESCLKQDNFSFVQGKVINIYIIYKIKKNWNRSYTTLKSCMFGTVKLKKHPDIDEHKYFG